jgi:transcriptional regulator with XRE-family HTH domain
MSVQENFTEKFKVARNYKIIRMFFGKEPADLTEDLGISKQNISTWENENGNPGSKFIDQMSKYFGLPRDVFYRDGLTVEDLKAMKNHTSVQNGIDNRQNMIEPEEVYRKLVEGNSEYRLIPKKLLDDYDILPKTEMESRSKVLDVVTSAMDQAKDALIDKYENLIMGYEGTIARLEKEKEDLQRQIPNKGEFK